MQSAALKVVVTWDGCCRERGAGGGGATLSPSRVLRNGLGDEEMGSRGTTVG